MIQAEIDRRFDYHAPDAQARERHQKAREAAKAFAAVILEITKEDREQRLAFTHLEQAMFWVNASIAREGS